MRQANGTGSIFKLSGNRRKPYAVQITTKVEYDETNDKYILKRKYIGYFATQKEARQCLAEYNAANITPDAYSLTLNDVWELTKPKRLEGIKEQRKEQILLKYRIYVSEFGALNFRSMKADDVQKIIDNCSSIPGKREVKGILHACYEYAIKNDICVKDYSKFAQIESYETKIKRTVLSERVPDFESAPISPYNDVTLILLYSGCRSAEILANSTSFDTENKLITITEAKNKSSIRTIPMHDKIVDVCKRYNERKRPTYRPYYAWAVEHEFKPHDTRHSFASRCHECGLNELVIQKLMGHTPQTITQSVYTHITLDEMRTELSKLKY